MKNGRLFWMAPMVWVLSVVLAIFAGITYVFSPVASAVEMSVAAILILAALVRLVRDQRDIDRCMERVARALDENDRLALARFPLPVAVVTQDGQVLWHNDRMQRYVLGGKSVIGNKMSSVLPNVGIDELPRQNMLEVTLSGKRYMTAVSRLSSQEGDLYVLYYLDVTEMKNAAEEYAATRPVTMLIFIDNLEDLMQTMRDSERAKIEGLVETALEDWLSDSGGILQKFENDRFFAVVEKRSLQRFIDSRFDILDRVRSIPLENHAQVTLSIGVGEGSDFRQSETRARQAIEMALGRGGDQVAVYAKNGFEFYGGLSKGVERRTKVRTRVIAAALRDLILAAENVLVMGHRFSDLDSVGSGMALVSAVRALGKPAYLVVDPKTSLAGELLDRYTQAGHKDWQVVGDKALDLVGARTLLIITDTQNPQMLEYEPIYRMVKTVAVIDHHRRMNGHIDKAVVFYHESFASSACEMVAELVQYMDLPGTPKTDAEALLSGIMLDTRGFVINAGARTFEAAAYLRRQGADTVAVKKLFTGGIGVYRRKAEIVSGAEIYRDTAIACASDGEETENRVACSQAADELLGVKGVQAAFTLFHGKDGVHISARSFGDFNVQLTMEALGGGGHLTMSGAQLTDVTLPQAVDLLKQAIDRYWDETAKPQQPSAL